MSHLFWVEFHPCRPDFHATMTAEEQAIMVRHLESLDAHHDAGILQFAGRAADQSHGLAVYEVDDPATMDRILAENPACAAGVLRAEAKPYRLPTGAPPVKPED